MAGKRSHGEGHVTRTASGKWRAQLMDGYNENGKRRIKSFTAGSKREVLQMMRDYREPRQTRADPNPTFGEWADRWYEDHRTQVAASTYSGYRFTLKLLKDRFGGRPLNQILPMDINGYLDELLKSGCSHSKISKCRAMLIQIFDSAEANGKIERSPARKSKVIKEEAVTGQLVPKAKDAFTAEEVELLMERLPDTIDGNGTRLLLGTGLRGQELLALTAKDIAEDGSAVSVTKAVKMVDGRATLGPPKSKTSVRTVPVPERYRASARYLRDHAGPMFIFRSSRPGQPQAIGSFRERYYELLDAIPGVRRLTPHCCRHTYVTRLQANGVPMETIARLAGHAGIGTTDGYLHVGEAALRRAAEMLDADGDEKSGSR